MMKRRQTSTRWTISEATLGLAREAGEIVLRPAGDWVLASANRLETLVEQAKVPDDGVPVLDLGDLGRLDTAGALILNRILKVWTAAGHDITIRDASDAHHVLINEVNDKDKPDLSAARRDSAWTRFILGLGKVGVGFLVDVRDITTTLGGAALYFARWILNPWRIRYNSTARQIQRMAIDAVPIVGLMSFLIGAIIAQQGAFYFRKFGAELYIVDMTGVLTLREIGVLLTAVMVAGRTGSSITAEIGSMKMREEVDALRVIGLDPIEVLVLPRLIGLVVAMPILTFLSDICAVTGAALVAVTYVGMPMDTFLFRLSDAITVQTLNVGLIKAPFMALIIGLISCVEGLQVQGSAESLGAQTTIAVVKSIFMVVVVDGLFAVFFAAANI